MEDLEIYTILKDIVAGMAADDPLIHPLPDALNPQDTLGDSGLDLTVLPEIRMQLKTRLQGKELDWDFLFDAEGLQGMSLAQLIASIRQSLQNRNLNPIVVYVDDEEENIFVFRRKFDKKFRLKTFSDSLQALDFIRKSDDVALVVTDEVMPNMGGNQLCDEVHRTKPYLKFVLVTGNPNQDEDLMYRSLRRNRFYEFIQKPMEMEKKGEEYEKIFRKLISEN